MKAKRQGDLIFINLTKNNLTNKIPKNLEKVEMPKDGYVLALGEKTGHKHVLVAEPEKIQIYKAKNGMMFFDVKEEAQIWHGVTKEDTGGHDTTILEPGVYIEDGQFEYDELEELRRVQD